jgi:hypothetical protein
MMQAIEGIYRNGRVELRETPQRIHQARVVVTFLDDESEILAEAQATPGRVPGTLLREMLAEGFISRLPTDVDEAEDDFEPVEISGEPLSETVIKERR